MRWTMWQPREGWRVFAGEVGVIVLGVLIALAAQQLVDDWSVRRDTDAATRALRKDFAAIVLNAHERIAEDGCIRARLEYLAGVLDTGQGRLPGLGDIGSPPARTWYPASWDSIVGTKVANALPRDDFVALGTIALITRETGNENVKELEAWAQLYRMVGPGRALSAVEAAELRAALARAALAMNNMRLDAPQLEALIEETALLDKADRREIDGLFAKVLASFNHRALCGPIGPVPQQRVTAPYDPKLQADPLAGLAVSTIGSRAAPADPKARSAIPPPQ